jgi:hypothetical protein
MNGMERIIVERKRQIEAEGYCPEHDEMHSPSELSTAAACYLICHDADTVMPHSWPWGRLAWKPKDRIRNLERAGALYLAAADLEQSRNGDKVEFYRGAAECVGILIDGELTLTP